MVNFTDGCTEIPNICTLRDSVKALDEENEALREAYSVNYTASLIEYQAMRQALERYASSHTLVRGLFNKFSARSQMLVICKIYMYVMLEVLLLPPRNTKMD